MDQHLKDVVYFQELLCTVTEDTIQDIVAFMRDRGAEFTPVAKARIIGFIIKAKPKKTELLLQTAKAISADKMTLADALCPMALYMAHQLGVLTDDDVKGKRSLKQAFFPRLIQKEDCRVPYDQDKIQTYYFPPIYQAIWDDNVQQLQEIVANDPEALEARYVYGHKYYFSAIQFLCHIGSLKCFRFCRDNKLISTKNQELFLSGNLEIAHSYDGVVGNACFQSALDGYNGDILRWLLERYNPEEIADDDDDANLLYNSEWTQSNYVDGLNIIIDALGNIEQPENCPEWDPPIVHAAKGGAFENIMLLVQKGANINGVDAYLHNALYYASGEAQQYLREHGAEDYSDFD